MSVFKKYPSPALFQRSVSEQDGNTTKIGCSLKDYHWCHQAKSKKLYEDAGLDLAKLLGAYRWQTPRFHGKTIKRADASKADEQPLRLQTLIADGCQEQKVAMPAARTFRVPFCRSISEPAPPAWRDRNPKPLLQPEGGGEPDAYFIRGFFSTISGSLSKVLNRREEEQDLAVTDETEDKHMDLAAGIFVLFLSQTSSFIEIVI